MSCSSGFGATANYSPKEDHAMQKKARALDLENKQMFEFDSGTYEMSDFGQVLHL